MAVPALSVILPTDGLDPIRRVLGDLRDQTAAETIELIVVTPRETAAEVANGAGDADFPALRVVEFDTRRSAAGARGSGDGERESRPGHEQGESVRGLRGVDGAPRGRTSRPPPGPQHLLQARIAARL